ncbi:ABC transporter substrate-binding protein [Uniformispora flossi]|uniref:ABC transporter substrate-binding protein n=1 Tax=Uniformispora flossi TaxID=3390723 RepID=UPI003C30CE3E
MRPGTNSRTNTATAAGAHTRRPARGLRRIAAAVAAVLCAALLTDGCGGSGGSTTVTVLGTWTGAEAEAFEHVVAPFERDTGIVVRYEGTRDVDAVLAARVDQGTPPDLAALSTPGDLIDYARTGRIVPLDTIPELAATDGSYAADWRTLGRVDGRRVAVVVKAALKGLLWYDPKTFAAHNLKPPATASEVASAARALSAAGIQPWCFGLASSSASGWPGTDWIENLVLTRSGPQVYDRWVTGELAWTSPEISSAWQAWGDLLTAGSGGPMASLLTSYDQAGTGLVASPPRCGMEQQASFASGWYGAAPGSPQPGVDFAFTPFPAPAASPGTAAAAPAREVAGDVMAMFRDTPAARQLLTYLAGTEAQTRWAREGSLSPNRGVPADAYPVNPVAQGIGQALRDADTIRFDASDLMPGAMRGAFYRAVLAYVADPGQLQGILADLDQARLAAYP